MKAILIGYGEIGRAVYNVFIQAHEIDVCDIKLEKRPIGKYEIMLVAIPYSEEFVRLVKEYQDQYKTNAIIIFSTVAIGTTSQIPNAVHSPVEGKHPELDTSISIMPRWVGGWNETVRRFFSPFCWMEVKICERPEMTEFIKLRSTSLYGVNIEFARYTKMVCDVLEIDYEKVNEFDRDYNELYKRLGMPDYQKYILYPPEGKIGGHCVLPNSVILDKQFPSSFLKEIYREK